MKWKSLSELVLVAIYFSVTSKASDVGISSRQGSGGTEELFNQSFYVGSEAQGIVTLRYQALSEEPLWTRQPKKCYGVLVNWQKAVVPCSCVSYSKNDSNARSSINYDVKRRERVKVASLAAKKVTVVNESYIQVGIMQDEYDPTKNKTNLVNVKKIRIHPKCNSLYNVNYATLDLEEKINGSRLIWVNQAVKRRLAVEIKFTAVASALTGDCFVVRYVDKKLKAEVSATRRIGAPPFEWLKNSSSSVNAASSADQTSEFELIKDYVTFTSWDTCLNNVCPIQPDQSVNAGKKGSYCTNEIEGKRWCTQWTSKAKLCGQPEGTPVFCHVRDFNGIMGLLYNTPFKCDQRSSHTGVMASFEEALDLVKYDLPLRHSARYLHSLPPDYGDYFKDPVLFEDNPHHSGSAAFKSFQVAPIIFWVIDTLVKVILN